MNQSNYTYEEISKALKPLSLNLEVKTFRVGHPFDGKKFHWEYVISAHCYLYGMESFILTDKCKKMNITAKSNTSPDDALIKFIKRIFNYEIWIADIFAKNHQEYTIFKFKIEDCAFISRKPNEEELFKL